ncbi:hypothetical protein COT94_00820 [Candidatus Falkowbacteria bacterium CG10_big_fil_rev_8_21_14_0_10_37_14]|uniref:NADH:quinone oxidoreductase/Mrp antiporter transmembrane domain-containing protein n=1 Tax=Candidatus Falkowbacteria bacterium CG10_big_fil_rev_8_21_14_0_10_37_14 TaxID=1974561 RepID=A0A2M6WUA7_9BACT|nr:hypothetical protein [Candidatus Falkowbacteria bacterium]PIT96364.1 MAG: hypothetical protein COT94_00820 [Candidatus Falkowbacteria bacterium CG10_big_fil_rev_8_21_14_0_10_37_14]
MEFIIIITVLLVAVIMAIITNKRSRVIEVSSFVASSIVLIEAFAIAFKVVKLGSYGFLPFFVVDELGALLIMVVACVGLAVVIYSGQYLKLEVAKNIIGFTRFKEFFVLLNLFLLAMFVAVSSNSPIFAWISIEATTLSTAFLISFYNKPSTVEAAWKYLVINSVGLLIGFMGTLLYFTASLTDGGVGLITWQGLLSGAAVMNPLVTKFAFILVLVGYGTKVGFFPMHTWKPDAYSKSPAPIGALFSGALLPVAFLIILKFKVITDVVVGPEFSRYLLMSFGLLSILFSAFIMVITKNYKRLLAYSSIENAGVMALGFGLGGLGVVAAIIHLLYHSLVKAALFLLSGNLLIKFHSAKISNVKGAIAVIPITSILLFTGFFAITGAPPFGMFFTKLMIFSVGITTHPNFIIIALLATALLFVGFFKHIISMIFGEKPSEIKKEPENFWLIFPPLLLLTVVLILSFYQPAFLKVLINNAASHY